MQRTPEQPKPEAADDRPPQTLYPAPIFARERVVRFVAGIRPYRTSRVRIEAETLEEKLLIHNYGHGGAGVTLSWGSAAEVVRLLVAHASEARRVAVLGAGVIGLSTAHELLQAGHAVTIYAEAFTPNTTSDVAGAQWAPSLVARGSSAAARDQFSRIVRESYARFRTMRSDESWGVFDRPNFDEGAGAGLGGVQHIPRDLIPPPEYVDSIPIEGVRRAGRLYRTMIIEPPIYLPRLFEQIRLQGATVIERTFTSMADVLALEEPVAINCLGFGAKAITDDARLIPMRGQLVHMQPQDLPYLLTHDNGYVFPRRDAVLLGGTFERGVDDPTPSESTCWRIYERNRRFFSGRD